MGRHCSPYLDKPPLLLGLSKLAYTTQVKHTFATLGQPHLLLGLSKGLPGNDLGSLSRLGKNLSYISGFTG